MFFFDELVNVGIHVEQIGVLSKLAIGQIEGAALLAAESGDGSAEGAPGAASKPATTSPSYVV